MRYAEIGILEDLFPFLDADPILARDSIVSWPKNILSYNGGLHMVGPSFNVFGFYAGQPYMVDSISAMSFADLMVFAAGEGAEYLFPDATRNHFLQQILLTYMDFFVDWPSGTVSFDTEEFIQVLQTALTFPDRHEEDWTLAINETLAPISIWDFYSAQMHEMRFGSDFVYWGFGGDGNLSVPLQLAISAFSENKDGAWQFLRGFLLPEHFVQYGYRVDGFPMNRMVFDEQLETARTPIVSINADGSEQIVPNHVRFDYQGNMVELFAITDIQKERILGAIADATRFDPFESVIFDMVFEEAIPFFHGDRSAEDAARIIQARVAIYVAEISR